LDWLPRFIPPIFYRGLTNQEFWDLGVLYLGKPLSIRKPNSWLGFPLNPKEGITPILGGIKLFPRGLGIRLGEGSLVQWGLDLLTPTKEFSGQNP